MGVEVALDQDHLQVTSNEVLVSRHSLAEVSAIAALQDTEGHLVVVGQCQVKGHPLAVVLDMMSREDARRLEEEVGLRLSRRLLRPSVHSSASQDTLCTETVPSAPPLTEMDPSTSLPDTCDKSSLKHNNQATVHASASSGPTRTQPPSSVVQPSPCSSNVSNQPSLSSKKISAGKRRLKLPAANMPATGTLLATPLRRTFHPSVSRVAHASLSALTVSKPLVSDAPVSTLPVATPLVSIPPFSTRLLSTRPQSTPSAPAPSVSNPSLFPRSVSIHQVSNSQVSTPLVSSSQVSTPLVSSSQVSTPLVSSSQVSTPLVSSSQVHQSPMSTRPLIKPALPTKPASTSTVSSRPVPPSRIFTPLVATLPVSTTSASNPTVSTSSVSTPQFPTRLLSLSRVVTPSVLASTESNKTAPPTPLCIPSVSTRPAFTRPLSKPIVATRPVSFPKISSPVSTRPVSIAVASNTAESNTAASNTAASNTAASNTAVSDTPDSITSVSTTAVSATPVSTTAESTLPVSDQSASPVMVSRSPMLTLPETTVSASTLPTSSPAVSTLAADPELRRRHSVVSSSSQEDDNSSGKVELILGTLNVDESEYLFIPGMKHTQEQDSSSSLEHELSVLLENEHQYLDILQRIKDARSAVKSELQNLLRRNERLADFHKDLFRDLHQEFPSCSGVARVFLARKEELEQYRYYIMNAPRVLRPLGQQTEKLHASTPR
ncbi:uncharacterized protein LOC127001079 [Eriocheir sinensis]|uniref:uncharacterized protein LOC127001079 n=1 Tax=Eriocheir sinensis TaxID=95602 RepID=UPI0021C7A778|nr:uncharacterized protein LOC127001079 [Eriocheir sinensis]